MPRCRHCHRPAKIHSRGLCQRCFKRPGLRERYPVQVTRFSTRGVGQGNLNRPPGRPSPATLPGTRERFLVLMHRAAAGRPLAVKGDGERSLK
jgi:hypothetical protein